MSGGILWARHVKRKQEEVVSVLLFLSLRVICGRSRHGWALSQTPVMDTAWIFDEGFVPVLWNKTLLYPPKCPWRWHVSLSSERSLEYNIDSYSLISLTHHGVFVKIFVSVKKTEKSSSPWLSAGMLQFMICTHMFRTTMTPRARCAEEMWKNVSFSHTVYS